MAINTSTNKFRVITTELSGLTSNSKFSDIKTPALVVNTSEGGIFYTDGSKSTLTQVAALPNHTHSYLPLSGGSLSGYLSSSDYLLGTGLIRVNAADKASNFGYIRAETASADSSNRGVVHIGSNYGGSSSISNTVSFDAIGIYRTCVGIGGTFTYATLKSNYDNSIKLDVSGNVKATKFIGDVSGNATSATTAATASKVTVGTGTGSSYRAIVVTNGEHGLYTAGTAAGKPQYNYSTGDVKAYSFTTDGGNFVGNLTGTASGNLALSGGTMTGRIKMSSTTYPQIYGNGTYLAFGYDSGASQVVIDSSCLRRGSSATVSLGSSTYPWSNLYSAGATLSGALTLSGTSGTASTINFTRDEYSYISCKKVLAIEPSGLASSGTTGYQFDASAFYPGVTMTYNIGKSSLGFNKVYTRYIDTAGSNYNLRFCASGTEGMNLGANKKLYVGGSTSATYTLQVNGEAYASNFITSSDKRLKTNIQEILNSSESLELPFYEFDYKSDNRHSYGHIAQDVEEIYPTVVMHDNTDDDYLALDYTTLHTIQIKALLDRIIKLEEEIKILKSSK